MVINNIEILRHAILTDDSTVCGSMYHDSLIWRIIALGANEQSLPVVLVTSDRLGSLLLTFVLCLLLFTLCFKAMFNLVKVLES